MHYILHRTKNVHFFQTSIIRFRQFYHLNPKAQIYRQRGDYFHRTYYISNTKNHSDNRTCTPTIHYANANRRHRIVLSKVGRHNNRRIQGSRVSWTFQRWLTGLIWPEVNCTRLEECKGARRAFIPTFRFRILQGTVKTRDTLVTHNHLSIKHNLARHSAFKAVSLNKNTFLKSKYHENRLHKTNLMQKEFTR